MIKKICTKAMTREEWLAERRRSIGGSDAGAILGLNPYASAYSLWAEKTGKVTPEDISDKEAVRLGHDLEDYVARRFCEATGKLVRRENYFIDNTAYPFAHALPDRMVCKEPAGLECKTTSSWEILKQCREGKYPDTWYAQIMHYMMVTGAKKWYLAVLCFGHGFYWFEIERSEDEIAALAAAERDFWSHVQRDTPPPTDGSEATQEAIRTIYADSSPYCVDLGAVESALRQRAAIKKQMDDLKELMNEQDAIVQTFMGEAERGESANWKVTWKEQERSTFDRKKWEADHGAMPEMYFKASRSRPFKVTAR